MMRQRTIHHLVLLAALVGSTASVSALSTDTLDAEAIETPRNVATSPPASIWDRPAPEAPVVVTAGPAAPSAPQRALGANPLWAIPLATLSETRERPIFSSSRRPPPPATAASVTVAKAPPPKPAEPDRPPLSLVGTIGSVDESFGIFVDQGTKAALRLKIGEDYQGWRLNEVHSREVTLLKDQRRVLLTLPQPGVGGEGRSVPSVTQASVTSVEPARPEPSRRLH